MGRGRRVPSPADDEEPPAEEFRVTSTAFTNGGKIPHKFTSDGHAPQTNLSPPIAWHNLPEGTESLAVIMVDVDAPDPRDPISEWVHWVVYDIPPALKELPGGLNSKQAFNEGMYQEIKEGHNDFKVPGYIGPNPPPNGTHRYVIRVYALDQMMGKLGNKVSKDKLEAAMEGHILAETEIVGTYSKEKFGPGRDAFVPPGRPQESGQGTPFPTKGA
ncbi:hypothetical protein CBR_g39562 [Chara braunii]|uniref:YbhB/YbcL family Raf kinase inhibitor-like protein n=1 Tax=Chara braunii TaxID=69332 RepID=A0A388LSC7_CHABU|nr:hypothetical protein CBR_g39562 [Chara braunii]|eukprot:GBG85103.1 hypothetical protein CBR_g39562 [Chara braunii]